MSTGNRRSLIEDKQVVGVTTSPPIVRAVISKSSLYDDHLRAAALGEDAVGEL